jgi:hypothetical protein
MPYTIEWLIEGRVLLSTLTGVITQPELKDFIEDIQVYLQQADPFGSQAGTRPVHHISNSLQLERVDISLKSLQLLVSAYKLAGKIGWQLDVNRHPINKMFANLATQFAHIQTRTFPTQDAAVQFLKDVDPTLRDAVWLHTRTMGDQTRPLRFTPDANNYEDHSETL